MKIQQQVHPSRGLRDIAREVKKVAGMKGFTRGFTTTLSRYELYPSNNNDLLFNTENQWPSAATSLHLRFSPRAGKIIICGCFLLEVLQGCVPGLLPTHRCVSGYGPVCIAW